MLLLLGGAFEEGSVAGEGKLLGGVIAVDFQLQLGNKAEDGGGCTGSSLYRG